MIDKVLRIDYKRLRREEQHSYNTDALHIIDKTCGPCGKLYNQFKDAADRLDFALTQKALQPSRSLADHDQAADSAWFGLQYRIKAGLYLPRTQAAAQKVDSVFSQTSNPTHLGYAQAYGALRTLLSQLYALGDPVLIEADVKEYVDYLQSCVDNFLTKRSEMMQAHASGRIGEITSIVKECARYWQKLAAFIEAMANAETLPNAEETVKQLNRMTALYKARIEARMAGDNEDEDENDNEITDAESDAPAEIDAPASDPADGSN